MKHLLIIFMAIFGLKTATGQESKTILPKVTTGSIERLDLFPSKFVEARNIDIWLPEGYSPENKYSVLYMHDGQMLFDANITWNHQEWGVDEVAGKLWMLFMNPFSSRLIPSCKIKVTVQQTGRP